jgi:hypothetical protein
VEVEVAVQLLQNLVMAMEETVTEAALKGR